MDATELKTKIDEINEQMKAVPDAIAANEKTVEEGKALVEDLNTKLQPLIAKHDEAMREEEVKALRESVTTLDQVIADMKKAPAAIFMGATDEEGKALDANDPYAGETYVSPYNDIRLANKGISDARERLIYGFEAAGLNPEGKAMTEGTDSQGGYLVRPQVERQIVEARELDNVMRQLCSKLQVSGKDIQLDQLGLTTTAGWVAELAQKPEGTGMTLASVTASVFTAAGLATISNQLLADSNPSIDGLVTADLAKRLVALEETAFLNGSGVGQPLGLLNTPGIGATALTSTAVLDLLDAILDAIAAVETNHGAPTAILMHPRTWTKILKSRDTVGAYYIDPTGGPQDPRTGQRGPVKTLWGYPIVTSNRIPTNLGGGTNESRVIVGDFREALILDRQGITVDESKHVYFTTNQTVFRAEQRVGFTAARTPLAFNVVGGSGLANA